MLPKNNYHQLLGIMIRETRICQQRTQKEVMYDQEGRICSRRTLSRLEHGGNILSDTVYHRLIHNLGYIELNHPLLTIKMSKLIKLTILVFYQKDDFLIDTLYQEIIQLEQTFRSYLYVWQMMHFLKKMLQCLKNMNALNYHEFKYYEKWIPYLSNEMKKMLYYVLFSSATKYLFCVEEIQQRSFQQYVSIEMRSRMLCMNHRYGSAFLDAFQAWKYARTSQNGYLQIVSFCQLLQALMEIELENAYQLWERFHQMVNFDVPIWIQKELLVTEIKATYYTGRLVYCMNAFYRFVSLFPSNAVYIYLNFIRSRLHLEMIEYSMNEYFYDSIHRRMYEYQLKKIAGASHSFLIKQLTRILIDVRSFHYHSKIVNELVKQEIFILLQGEV